MTTPQDLDKVALDELRAQVERYRDERDQALAERDGYRDQLATDWQARQIRDLMGLVGKAHKERDEALAALDVTRAEYAELEQHHRTLVRRGAELEQGLRETRPALDRVRGLHKPRIVTRVVPCDTHDGSTVCSSCQTEEATACSAAGCHAYPCPTIRAVDGGGQ